MAMTPCDKKPELGDLIEVFRGSYQHWALYIGDGYVVHLAALSEVAGAGSSSVKSVLTEKALVKKEKLWDVVGTDRWKINNCLDEQYEPRPVPVILREARALVGTELSYCIFSENCEHFATELRYGRAESRQVRVAMAVGGAALLGLGAVALAGALSGGSNEEENKNTQ